MASVLSTLVFAQTSVAAINQPVQKTHCESYKQSAYNCCVNNQTQNTTLKQTPPQQKTKTFANLPLQYKRPTSPKTHSTYKKQTLKNKPLQENLRGIIVKNE